MKEIQKVRPIRARDKEWEEFNKNRQDLDLTWNQYIQYINKQLTLKDK